MDLSECTLSHFSDWDIECPGYDCTGCEIDIDFVTGEGTVECPAEPREGGPLRFIGSVNFCSGDSNLTYSFCPEPGTRFPEPGMDFYSECSTDGYRGGLVCEGIDFYGCRMDIVSENNLSYEVWCEDRSNDYEMQFIGEVDCSWLYPGKTVCLSEAPSPSEAPTPSLPPTIIDVTSAPSGII